MDRQPVHVAAPPSTQIAWARQRAHIRSWMQPHVFRDVADGRRRVSEQGGCS